MQEVSLLFAVLEENWLEIFGVGNRVSHALQSSRVAHNIHLSASFFSLLLAAVQPYVVYHSLPGPTLSYSKFKWPFHFSLTGWWMVLQANYVESRGVADIITFRNFKVWEMANLF